MHTVNTQANGNKFYFGNLLNTIDIVFAFALIRYSFSNRTIFAVRCHLKQSICQYVRKQYMKRCQYPFSSENGKKGLILKINKIAFYRIVPFNGIALTSFLLQPATEGCVWSTLRMHFEN